jgi:hypothetical protein
MSPFMAIRVKKEEPIIKIQLSVTKNILPR